MSAACRTRGKPRAERRGREVASRLGFAACLAGSVLLGGGHLRRSEGKRKRGLHVVLRGSLDERHGMEDLTPLAPSLLRAAVRGKQPPFAWE